MSGSGPAYGALDQRLQRTRLRFGERLNGGVRLQEGMVRGSGLRGVTRSCRFSCALVVLLVYAFPSAGSAAAPKVPPSVHGVAVGTSLTETLQRLGVPISAHTDCQYGPGMHLVFSYTGLNVMLSAEPDPCADQHNAEFRVLSITVTSASWDSLSLPRIGSRRSEVLKLLGNPQQVDGDQLIYWFPGVVYVSVDLSGDLVERVELGTEE